MTSNGIRQQFIEFFADKGHTFVPSSPVVPYDDPTLLFTNAGMNQFKDVFLGTGRRDYTRAVNTQKCIRAGGKHNDLDDVGHDTYHHTFFEMLGNWSFGDYFKAEAIEWAWELLVDRWGLDGERLHASYFEGDAAEGLEPDAEARDLWLKILPSEQVHAGGKKDNFWEMGDTGPCGPCSEIHIDLTPDKSGRRLVNAGDPRVIEIWNLVFIQFNRDACGKLTPLPAKHVDTGMGFERVTALLQGKSSNYDTDIFTPIFDAIREVTGAPPYSGLLESDLEQSRDREGAESQSRDRKGAGLSADVSSGVKAAYRDQVMIDVAYRVIADHLRCLTFAITDGCLPDREGRGYVLRRILRRAVRYGRQYLDVHEPFLHSLVPVVVNTMCEAFPELRAAHGGSNSTHVAAILREEEQSFGRTIDRGLTMFIQGASPLIDIQHSILAEGEPVRQRLEEFVQIGEDVHAVLKKAATSQQVLSNPLLQQLRSQLKPMQELGERLQKQLEPIQQLGERLRKQLEPMQELGERLRKQLEPMQRLGERLRKQLEPMHKLTEQLRQEVKPLQESWVELQDQLNPTIRLGDELREKIEHLRLRIDGQTAFRLYDTYGFPIDLTEQMAAELGMDVDVAEYERLMGEARERARTGKLSQTAALFTNPDVQDAVLRGGGKTEFIGYDHTECMTTIDVILTGENPGVEPLMMREGEVGILVLLQTPFYAERGGQVGDVGTIEWDNGVFEVTDSQAVHETTVHYGRCVKGYFGVYDAHLAKVALEMNRDPNAHLMPVTARVDVVQRLLTMKNHTSTHIMNWALRGVLGLRVQQKGSLVDPEKTRFDFSHPRPVTPQEIKQIEDKANAVIRADYKVYVEHVPKQEAEGIKTARRVFGETYPKEVRVVSVGAPINEMVKRPDDPKWMGYAVELCGGTHLKRTGEAELFRIIEETAVAKGIRRITAVTGERAKKCDQSAKALLDEYEEVSKLSDEQLAERLPEFTRRANEADIPYLVRLELREKLVVLRDRVKNYAKRQAHASATDVRAAAAKLLAEAATVGASKVIVGEMPQAEPEQIREAIDYLRSEAGSAGICLGCVTAEKVLLFGSLTDDLVDKGLKAGDLIKEVAPIVGGGGGGKPQLAQAGGKHPAGLPQALEKARNWLTLRLQP